MIWNCEHKNNKCLTPEFVSRKSGAFLHRFKWLSDNKIGELEKLWNWLAIEYDNEPKAKIVHYTLGTPCFKEYSNKSLSLCLVFLYATLVARSSPSKRFNPL